ncbi:beta-ketoacyl synthase N-terminal-like domain-containing protein [Polyangium sp. 15x6]|uniref:beta-ketoacyl synthase N-terminal-like domain-containing protein n=1 Tax=Polyangium sp. 15x6 TaxID=3042687 RepID=UPI00249AD91E|nr:beta-ketoacyl synthase N-terminal-like domain-containing protein [Polyangium sp. 15x6]MDI3285378.1 beta-ketoacyl synthase N-terminal-like domain-containing protein [Polyangium sp. 15x6]
MTHAGRMAVTGFALRTPLGDDPAAVLRKLLAGERAAAPNAHFDASTYACRLAATIPGAPRPTKHRKFVKRMGLFGMEVGAEALARSGAPATGARLGLFCGYGGLRAHWDDLMPVLERQAGDERATGAWAQGFSLLHPFWMLFHLSNNAHALLSIDVGGKGDGTTTAGSNAGAQALSAAIVALAMERVDAALVFAYDSLVEPETILSLGMSGAATQANTPAAIVAPYDERAAGIVPGEAAAALVLERPEDAGKRAISFVSAAATADGAVDFPSPRAIASLAANLSAGDTIVDGAALASPARDAAERAALADVLGPSATLLALTASTGQLGGATAVVQAILLAEALRTGALPPIAGLDRPAEGPLRPLLRAEETRARSALALSAGMPGLAGALRVEVP